MFVAVGSYAQAARRSPSDSDESLHAINGFPLPEDIIKNDTEHALVVSQDITENEPEPSVETLPSAPVFESLEASSIAFRLLFSLSSSEFTFKDKSQTEPSASISGSPSETNGSQEDPVSAFPPKDEKRKQPEEKDNVDKSSQRTKKHLWNRRDSTPQLTPITISPDIFAVSALEFDNIQIWHKLVSRTSNRQSKPIIDFHFDAIVQAITDKESSNIPWPNAALPVDTASYLLLCAAQSLAMAQHEINNKESPPEELLIASAPYEDVTLVKKNAVRFKDAFKLANICPSWSEGRKIQYITLSWDSSNHCFLISVQIPSVQGGDTAFFVRPNPFLNDLRSALDTYLNIMNRLLHHVAPLMFEKPPMQQLTNLLATVDMLMNYVDRDNSNSASDGVISDLCQTWSEAREEEATKCSRISLEQKQINEFLKGIMPNMDSAFCAISSWSREESIVDNADPPHNNWVPKERPVPSVESKPSLTIAPEPKSAESEAIRPKANNHPVPESKPAKIQVKAPTPNSNATQSEKHKTPPARSQTMLQKYAPKTSVSKTKWSDKKSKIEMVAVTLPTSSQKSSVDGSQSDKIARKGPVVRHRAASPKELEVTTDKSAASRRISQENAKLASLSEASKLMEFLSSPYILIGAIVIGAACIWAVSIFY